LAWAILAEINGIRTGACSKNEPGQDQASRRSQTPHQLISPLKQPIMDEYPAYHLT
jgi:hypothetical protein